MSPTPVATHQVCAAPRVAVYIIPSLSVPTLVWLLLLLALELLRCEVMNCFYDELVCTALSFTTVFIY